MKENLAATIGIIFIVIISFSGVSAFFGLMETFTERFDYKTSGCQYKSYASRYNPVFKGVCELFRDRTLKSN